MMRKIQKIVLVCAAWIGVLNAAPAIWDGSADISWYKPDAQKFTLMTAEELAGVAKLVNEGTSDFKGQTIALGADIFINDTAGAGIGTWASVQRTAWIPIGTNAKPFKGEFDGIAGKKNRKIYGLYINDTTQNYAGLFGYTDSVKISNLDILVGRVTAKNNVGALVGFAVGGSVSGVHSEVKVTGTNHVGGLVGYSTGTISTSSVKENVAGQDSVGGLVGVTTNSISGTTKSNSYFIGNVIGRKYTGGIVGAGSSISKSYAEGSVNGFSYVGGVAGNVTGSIDFAYHVGGGVYGDGYVGGLVGHTSSVVKNSYSEGKVSGTDNYVGGLVGYGVSIDSSYHAKGEVYGRNYVGGLVGYASSEVKKSYSEGDVSGTNNYVGGLTGYGVSIDSSHHAKGEVYGQNYVGGLVGYASSEVKNSYSEGGVTGQGNYVGGLIGLSYYYYSGSFNDSIMTAQNSYAIGNVKGKGYVGGLIGLDSIYRYSNNTKAVVKKISNSHSVGKVVGKDKYVGGVLGKSNYGYRSSSYSSNIALHILSSYHKGFVESDSNYVGGVAGYACGIVDSTYHIDGYVNGFGFVGGLIGLASSAVKNSYSEGNVSGAFDYVGGLVGQTSSTVKNSYSKGNVVGPRNYVGGLVGKGVSVDSSNHVDGDVSGQNYVGGLVGYASSEVKNSYSEGDVVGTSFNVGGLVGYGVSVNSSNHTKGNVNGYGYVGGLIGQTSSAVTNSYSEGNVTGSSDVVGGLIGQTSSEVKNSYSKGNVISQGNYVGGLIGLSYYYYSGSSDISITTVQNSYAAGNVNGKGYVGGLIGLDSIYRYSSNKTILVKKISNSHSVGKVVGKDKYVGGVLGKSNYGYYSYGTNISLQIFSSNHMGFVESDSGYVGGVAGYASGIIDSTYHINGDVKGYGYVGGIVGQTTSSVTNSYSEGNVFGSLDYVGGVAGSISGGIRNAHAEAKFVKGRNLVGGLAGYVGGSLTGYVGGSIVGSYFEGDSVSGNFEIGGLVGCAKSIVDSSYSTTNVEGDDNVGGLIGSAYGSVSNSYALGNVDGVGEGAGAGHDNLGGLVGYQYKGSVLRSMALGNVTGTTNLGGLIGRFDGTKITQSYANGDVTGYYYGDPIDEVGNYYIGGFVGHAKGSLDEVYASGVVKGIENGPVYTGCIVGYIDGSLLVTKSYYDKVKCDLGIDGGEEIATVSGSPAKTTAEMQIQETFEDWNFAEIWKIKENTYPFLQIYSNSLANAVVTTASLEGIVYDETAKTPLVTSVSLFGETLEYETEYTITYKDNINAGTASINVCGVKPYGGCNVVKFDIAGIAVKPAIAAIDNMTYTGRALTPEVEVYNGGALLATTDYSVEYKDNVNAGTATVMVTMKGNYSGSASKVFTIEKATPVITQNPTASDVVLGQTLAASELSGGCANVDGEFVWKSPTAKPKLENEGFAVFFVPTDTNYTKSAEIIVPIKVLDMVYVAVHVGGNTLDSAMLIRGSSYTLPNISDSTGYDFVGLYNGKTVVGKPGDQISISENTVIEAVYKVKTFEITFKNGTTVLQSGEIAYGVLPEYAGAVPTKTANAQYTYTFIGWKPAIVEVTGPATYEATFDSSIRSFTVTFKKGTSVLQSMEVAYGMIPTAPTVTLPKNTALYTYSFGGWDKEIAPVTENATYTAIIDSVVNKYKIVFKNYDGTLIKDSTYTYGSTVVKPADPTRAATAKYTFAFKGWTPTVADVTTDAVYKAVFDSTIRNYTVVFVNDSDTLQSNSINYGVTPSYKGGVPTKQSTAQYEYTFKGWSPSVAYVSKNTTYRAVFDSTLRKYTVSFMSENKKMQTSDVVYGKTPVYSGSTPTKMANDSCTYKFSGWNPKIQPVADDIVYSAEFSVEKKKYLVRFMVGNSTQDIQSVAYGDIPEYKGKTPTKKSTILYSYEFVGWTPKIGRITKETNYEAVFDSTKLTGIMDNQFANLEMSVNVISRNIQVSAAPIGSAYAILDMQGRVLKNGRVESVNFNIAIQQAGNYLVRIGGKTQVVNVK